MPRKNPVPPEKIEEGCHVRALREELKIPRTTFAAMCGISYQSLESKESGRNPFRPEEIAHIKKIVAAHLAAGFAALKSLPS